MHPRVICCLLGTLLAVIVVSIVAIMSYIQWSASVDVVNDYQRLFLHLINGYRAKHHVSPLYPSADLNHRATQCAQFYAIKGNSTVQCPYKPLNSSETTFDHRGNISSLSVANEDIIRDALDEWYYYKESGQDSSRKQSQNGSSNFAKMLWDSSKNVGFGIGKYGNMVVGYALYSPAMIVFDDKL